MTEAAQEDLRTWEAWHKVHQPFERDWWQQALDAGHYTKNDKDFFAFWKEVRAFIEPHGRIIDIGCGPRPPFIPCTVIEPLADEYRKMGPAKWWDRVTVYAQPAEQRIDGLTGDTIICWNCIDHAVGWREILENMRAYGSEHARYAIATDFWEPFVGHPGFEREAFMAEVAKRFRITRKREPFGRHLALLMVAA